MNAIHGTVIIKPVETRKEQEGLIYIPKVARRVKSKIGKVVSIEPYPVGGSVRIWKGGKRRWHKPTKQEAQEQLSLKGEYILVEEGQQFIGDDKQSYIKARVEHIIAVVDEPEAAELVPEVAERCPRCKSNGESNLLLDDKGYCLKCGLNTAGDRRQDHEMKVSDDLSEFMAGRDNRDESRAKAGVAEKARIMSYSGQSHRSKLITEKR